MRFTHDCDRCRFLGHYWHVDHGLVDLYVCAATVDLYVCPPTDGKEIWLYRFGNLGWSCSTSLKRDAVEHAARYPNGVYAAIKSILETEVSVAPQPANVTPQPYPYLDQLIYCIDSGFPAPVTEAMLELASNTENLTRAFTAWNSWGARDSGKFGEAVEEVTGDECLICGCGRITWQDESTYVAGLGAMVCNDYCLEGYGHCSSCEEYVIDTTSVGYGSYCNYCLERNYSYCEYCDEYFDNDDDHSHGDGCDCEAPHPHFKFPANGHLEVRQNERLTVELPKGTISEVGLNRIKRLLYDAQLGWGVDHIVDEVGPEWRPSGRASFTKRLSQAFYKQGIKLEDGVISKIGNLAREHSSDTAIWHIEFTRDLNEPAENFCHEDSCWWSSHSASRCCLKSWGGLGLRTFCNPFIASYRPSGRIWVQPLNSELSPTHNAFTAHAYVIFNGYGHLSGYVAARIVAHLTSKSYRKVSLSTEYQYINNGAGFLVADETTCNATDSLYFGFGEHDQQDAHNYNQGVLT